jgi:hypothetical protein
MFIILTMDVQDRDSADALLSALGEQLAHRVQHWIWS